MHARNFDSSCKASKARKSGVKNLQISKIYVMKGGGVQANIHCISMQSQRWSMAFLKSYVLFMHRSDRRQSHVGRKENCIDCLLFIES